MLQLFPIVIFLFFPLPIQRKCIFVAQYDGRLIRKSATSKTPEQIQRVKNSRKKRIKSKDSFNEASSWHLS